MPDVILNAKRYFRRDAVELSISVFPVNQAVFSNKDIWIIKGMTYALKDHREAQK